MPTTYPFRPVLHTVSRLRPASCSQYAQHMSGGGGGDAMNSHIMLFDWHVNLCTDHL